MESNRTIGIVFIIAALLGGLFHFMPQIDLQVSHFFYDPERGFFWRDTLPAMIIHQGVYVITGLLGVLWISLLVLFHLRGVVLWDLQPKKLIYLISVLVIGPGLLINIFFKNHLWGRARPIQITEFGGTQEFSAAFTISDQCASNCAFVSGHTSMAFYFLAVALITTGKWRARWLWFTALFSVLTVSARIVQGAHFLSDTLFAGFTVYFVAVILYRVFFGKERA